MAKARFVIPAAVRQAMSRHARRERPRECCGLLVGRGHAVVVAVETTNMARTAVHYEVNPREHIDLRRVLRHTHPRLAILGVYHSHPRGTPEPSPTDVAQAMYPAWVHVIVGLAGGRARLRAFRIRRGRVTRVSLD